jgi:NADH-ubiquinone oxidoreductase chain 4
MFICAIILMIILFKDVWLLGIGLGVFLIFLNFISYYSSFNYFGLLRLDKIRISLCLLTVRLILLMLIRSTKFYYSQNYLYYNQLLLSILFILTIIFVVKRIFLFYIYFELALIPIFLIILGWGGQPEKLQSGIYIFFYTLFGSLPFLGYLVYFLKSTSGSLFNFYFCTFLRGKIILFYLFFLLIFSVKVPLFGFHLWLPRAHVEAPVTGSIILAGVLLKLGGYGLIRFLYLLQGIFFFKNFFMALSLIGGLLISMICLTQRDLKILVAYSSVVHISLVIGGLLRFILWGVWGGLLLIMGHGFCSSLLFYMLNLNYERSRRRTLILNKGYLILLPSFGLWWFIGCIGNISNPPRLSLFGEIMLIRRIVSYSLLILIILFVIFFTTSVYTIFLFNYVYHGKNYNRKNYNNISLNEMGVCFSHIFLLNSIFLVIS